MNTQSSAQGPDADKLVATIEVLERLFALVRQLALHGAEHDQARQGAAALGAALAQACPPFALQLLPEAVLRDGVPLPLAIETHRRAQQLVGALARWGMTELTFERELDAVALIQFAEAVLNATHSNRSSRVPHVAGLRLRPLRRPGAMQQGGEAADDVYATRQLDRALADLERILSRRDRPWPWAHGRAVVWRLERCLLASVTATGRALELAPGPLSPARRALAAAFHASAVLSGLHADLLVQRSATHALLVLGVHGLLERPGAELADAARRAWPLLLPKGADTPGIDPHRLRATALIAAAAAVQGQRAPLPLLALVSAAYELERKRCPEGTELLLSRADLHAWLAGALGREVHAGWGRALLGVLGPVPAGSHVLADGKLGVVIGPASKGEPLRPRVLVGGQVTVPSNSVTLHSPLGMTPWAK